MEIIYLWLSVISLYACIVMGSASVIARACWCMAAMILTFSAGYELGKGGK